MMTKEALTLAVPVRPAAQAEQSYQELPAGAWPEPNGSEPVDPADIIAGALQTSRAYAYELMERAVLERHSLQPVQPASGEVTDAETTQAVARGWIHYKNCDKEMDVDLAFAISEEISKLLAAICAELAAAKDALEFAKNTSAHFIPSYAYADFEVGCDLAHRLAVIYDSADKALTHKGEEQ